MTQRIVLAQINPLVGDIAGNAARVIEVAREARVKHAARIVVFPELVLTGYPPEDLLLRPALAARVDAALEQICEFTRTERGLVVVVGAPMGRQRLASPDFVLVNAALVIANGEIRAQYAKQELPNDHVFDERRYFVAGSDPCVIDVDGARIALLVCEDIWHPGPIANAVAAGAHAAIVINASPFHAGKQLEREQLVSERAKESGVPVAYVNSVGGQDELVFDGGSFVVNRYGRVVARAPHAVEHLLSLEFRGEDFHACADAGSRALAPVPTTDESVYDALVLCVRDYINKNGFRGALLGLSGGIDSALTLAIAVDAVGADRVAAVMMPFRYTAQMSIDDAAEEAKILGVKFDVITIEPMFDAFMQGLAPQFAGTARDTTEENLQARCRGVILMALSNKQRGIVLTTGNKSEMAVGYATLYGDMAGGFDVLKDVLKVRVFELSEYRNAVARARGETPPIPQRVIDRPPSAELAPDQKDSDSLPEYPVLDDILRRYIERDESAEAIVAAGFDRDTVYRVVRMVDRNEYKRRQAAVGPRVTRRGFGKDRRYPITNGWVPGN